MENMLMNPAQLTQMGQVPFYLMPDAHNWMKQAQSADAATLQEIMAARQREAQLHPLKMQQGQATLESTLLGNQGKQLDLQKQKTLQPKQIESELAELVSKADEREWQDSVRKIYKGMQAGNPEMMRLYEQLPEMVKLRKEHQNRMALEQEESRRAFGVANINADKAKTVQELRNRASMGGKMPKNPRELMTYYTTQANMEDDTEKREKLLELAEAEWQKVIKQAVLEAQARQAGNPTLTPGPTGQPVLGERPVPTPGAMPRAASSADATKPPKLAGKAAEDWITRAMSANKGMTREQVIAEGKRLGKL